MTTIAFNSALSNFTTDVAAGGAIRHLTDLGYSISEICGQLDYPIGKDKVAQIMWNHLVDTGVICMDNPQTENGIERVSYVKEYGKYGRSYLKRVVEKKEYPSDEYIVCDFGRMRYKNPVEFEEKANRLDASDREYVLLLPWPLTPVYHMKNERILRINNLISI